MKSLSHSEKYKLKMKTMTLVAQCKPHFTMLNDVHDHFQNTDIKPIKWLRTHHYLERTLQRIDDATEVVKLMETIANRLIIRLHYELSVRDIQCLYFITDDLVVMANLEQFSDCYHAWFQTTVRHNDGFFVSDKYSDKNSIVFKTGDEVHYQVLVNGGVVAQFPELIDTVPVIDYNDTLN